MTKLSLKERAAQHRVKRESKLNYFLTNLTDNINACMLTNDSDMHFIISPSNYKPNHYQLTTFIRNEPYSHTTESSIIKLITENIGELLTYEIQEAI